MGTDRTIWKRSLITREEVFDVEVIRWGGRGWGIRISSGEQEIDFHPDDWSKLASLVQEACIQCPYPARDQD